MTRLYNNFTTQYSIIIILRHSKTAWQPGRDPHLRHGFSSNKAAGMAVSPATDAGRGTVNGLKFAMGQDVLDMTSE